MDGEVAVEGAFSAQLGRVDGCELVDRASVEVNLLVDRVAAAGREIGVVVVDAEVGRVLGVHGQLVAEPASTVRSKRASASDGAMVIAVHTSGARRRTTGGGIGLDRTGSRLSWWAPGRAEGSLAPRRHSPPGTCRGNARGAPRRRRAARPASRLRWPRRGARPRRSARLKCSASAWMMSSGRSSSRSTAWTGSAEETSSPVRISEPRRIAQLAGRASG